MLINIKLNENITMLEIKYPTLAISVIAGIPDTLIKTLFVQFNFMLSIKSITFIANIIPIQHKYNGYMLSGIIGINNMKHIVIVGIK